MAVIEILLGERTHQGLVGGITFDPNEGLICGVVNGFNDREPVAQLRERFAKLKARDNLLGAVLARLELGPNAGEDHAVAVLDRWLADKKAGDVWNDKLCATLTKIAKGLGLRDGGAMMKPDELAAQVLTMNTELSSALAKAQEEVKALAQENANLRSGVELERNYKLQARADASDLRGQRDEMEAEIQHLKILLTEADLGRIMAEATAAGMRTALQHLERVMREKLRT